FDGRGFPGAGSPVLTHTAAPESKIKFRRICRFKKVIVVEAVVSASLSSPVGGALRSAEENDEKESSMAISGDFHIFIYIEGKNERRESALSTMIDLKGKRPECHIHPGGSARPAGYGWHFAKAVTQTKGNSNGDCAAVHVRVLC